MSNTQAAPREHYSPDLASDAFDDGQDPREADCGICGELIGHESWYWKKMGGGGYGRAHAMCDTSCPFCGGDWPDSMVPCPECGATIEQVGNEIAEASR